MNWRAAHGARLAILLLALFCGCAAIAHLTPNSEVQLSAADGHIDADIVVPQGEYAFGTKNAVDGSPGALQAARRYLSRKFSVTSPNGKLWSVSIDRVEFVQIAGPPDLHATAVLVPPKGSGTREFAIDWHVLVDSLPGHFALFVLRDPEQPEQTTILGAVRAGSPPLRIRIAAEGPFSALSSAISLGARHILGGYDHLMFLLALLLPAPLIAKRRRWTEHRSIHETLVKLGQIVTAFTIGHSITLVGATVSRWSLPTSPVEVAIAVSVLVSAIHAARPLLPGREPAIALFFGLIHGLAFATLIQQVHAGRASGAIGLFGFNLGIELVQLTIVAAIVPSLIVLSRRALYTWLRPALAWLCAGAALAWIVNRTTGAGDTFVRTMENAMDEAVWLVLGLTFLALVLFVRDQLADRKPREMPINAVRIRA